MTEETPKVYILLRNFKTSVEIIGVYTTKEKALKSYQNVISDINGFNPTGMVGIIEWDLE